MHPAVSVIFFTVTSGAGFGAIALLGLGWPMAYGALGVFLVCLAAGGLAVAGLLASTFHLGHPERAWRAFSQWRSSWLSREGVAAVATLLIFGLYALIWMVTGERIAALGWLVALGSIATVVTTSMIYAQLKTVPHWHSWLTPACYLAFSVASGLLFVATFGSVFRIAFLPVSLWVLIVLLIAWGFKLAWWRRVRNANLAAAGSTPESATGLGFIGKVHLLERPHTGGNYLTREMVHKVGRKHAEALRFTALTLGGLAPFLVATFVYLTAAAPLFFGLAFLLLLAGLFAERWLFFAEAEHSVSLYYD